MVYSSCHIGGILVPRLIAPRIGLQEVSAYHPTRANLTDFYILHQLSDLNWS
jgi:hypothetical protein